VLRMIGTWLVAILAGLIGAAMLGGTIVAIVIGLVVAYAVRYLLNRYLPAA
jgi:hypothetical protein